MSHLRFAIVAAILIGTLLAQDNAQPSAKDGTSQPLASGAQKSNTSTPPVPGATSSSGVQPSATQPPDSTVLVITKKVKADYPAAALPDMLQGQVVVRVVVDEDGDVESTEVISGSPVLAQAAADAAKQWKFKPFIRNGQPVKAGIKLPFDFAPPIAPPMSAQYPNTAEGLQSLMNDMLAATKRGDRQGVDAFIRQTEFADYAAYLVRTYTPDPLAGEDWIVTYRQWLGNNEDQLRELLQSLAKDEGGKILVRKASDDPAKGRGFEWGIVHYARIPIDVYCVTLVFSHSPDGPGELIGYFVYADGMFRWDSIVPFAKPGSYQSDPGTLNGSPTQAAGSAQYPNTPDGLQQFLSDLRAAAKSGDQAKVDSMVKQTEIPEYRNWFCSVYVPGSGLSWATPYWNNLAQSEQSFKETLEKLAQGDQEIQVRKLVDKPGGDRDMEWGMIHNSRTPLDIYHAGWKVGTAPTDEWGGYFIYIDGMFRLQNSGRRVAVTRLPGGIKPLPAPAAIQTASVPGVYRVGGGVSAPRALFWPDPEYSDEARRAKYEGTCVLSFIVGPDGLPRDIRVARSLGMGLDEKAIEAVKKWRFQPALKDGRPVSAAINIEVKFRL